MAGVGRHEDLVAWQLCVELDALIFEATSTGPGARDFEWRDQIRGSAGSAAPNIAEGFGRFGPREFVRYLRIALGSLEETSTHLILARGRGYLTDPAHARLTTLCHTATDINDPAAELQAAPDRERGCRASPEEEPRTGPTAQARAG
jgi:four helix bundle protein